MGLIDRARNIAKKIVNRIRGQKKLNDVPDSRLVKFDTSLIFVPKYEDLTDEEKALVEEYKKEINVTDVASLIHYAADLSDDGNINTKIVTDLLYREEQKPIVQMDTEEILGKRLKTLIHIEEIKAAREELDNMAHKGRLRIVALDEVQKEENSLKERISGAFKSAERIHRRNKREMLLQAKERMQIAIKAIDQQCQATDIAIAGELDLPEKLEKYEEQLEKDTPVNAKQLKQVILLDYLAMQKEICKMILPEELEEIARLRESFADFTPEQEQEIVKKIASIQRKTDIYAYKNKEEVENLKKSAQTLAQTEKIRLNGKKLLGQVEELRTKYKIFENYLTQEDKDLLYEVKFEILVSRLYTGKQSPFAQIKSREEKEAYERIVEKKLEKLFKLETPYKEEYKKLITQIKDGLVKQNITNIAKYALENENFLDFIVWAEKRINGEFIEVTKFGTYQIDFGNSHPFDSKASLYKDSFPTKGKGKEKVYYYASIVFNKENDFSFQEIMDLYHFMGEDCKKRMINTWLKENYFPSTTKTLFEVFGLMFDDDSKDKNIATIPSCIEKIEYENVHIYERWSFRAFCLY